MLFYRLKVEDLRQTIKDMAVSTTEAPAVILNKVKSKFDAMVVEALPKDDVLKRKIDQHRAPKSLKQPKTRDEIPEKLVVDKQGTV